MSVLDLTAETFDGAVSSGTALVDFWASWCGPCKAQGPVVEAFADKHPEVKVCKVNVDDERELAMRFRVMSIPTLLVFKNGEAAGKTVGLTDMEELEELCK